MCAFEGYLYFEIADSLGKLGFRIIPPEVVLSVNQPLRALPNKAFFFLFLHKT